MSEPMTATEMMLKSRDEDFAELKRRRIADAAMARAVTEVAERVKDLPDSDHPFAEVQRIVEDVALNAAYHAVTEYAKLITGELGELRAHYKRTIEMAALLPPAPFVTP